MGDYRSYVEGGKARPQAERSLWLKRILPYLSTIKKLYRV